ncbi:MAG: hypothetical protein M3362_11660 [Acidobacteriota bacterium]|nr:hypothetical protein [Acidobacteriota bacterium]
MIRGEDAEQHERGQREQAVNYTGVAKPPVIELHHQEHRAEADCGPQALLEHVIILVAVLRLRHHGRRAVDHDYAEEREPGGGREQPFVCL